MGYPYYPPGWIPAPQPCETKRGVGHMVKAMYCTIAVMLLSLVILAVLLAGLIDNLDGASADEDVGAVFGAIAAIAVLGLVIFICGLAGFIFFIMGVSEINRGRHEFGSEHARKVRLAIVFLVLAIVIYVVSFAASLMILMDEGLDPMSGYAPLSEEDFMLSVAVGGILSLVSAVFSNLFVVYLVAELADERLRKLLWAGFGIALATSAMSLILSLYFVNYGVSESMFDTYSSYSMYLPISLSFISYIFYLVCYRGILAKLESGELKPALQAQVPMPYPPYPAYYPPPPPPPPYQ